MPGNKKKEIAAEPGALESEAGVQTEEQEQGWKSKGYVI